MARWGGVDPTKVVITADVHVDAGRHSQVNPETGRQRAWENAARCLAECAEIAVREEAGLFILAGDLFIDGNPTPEAQALVGEALAPLFDAGISILMVPGNHEYIGLPPGHRHVLYGFDQWGLVPHNTRRTLEGNKKEPKCWVVSEPGVMDIPEVDFALGVMPWPRRSVVARRLAQKGVEPQNYDQATVDLLKEDLDTLSQKLLSIGKPALLVGHLAVAEATLRGSEVSIGQLVREPLVGVRTLMQGRPWGAAVLGHIHRRQRVDNAPEGDPGGVWYTGAPERVDFSEADDRVLMASVVTCKDGQFQMSGRPLRSPRKLILVDASNDASIERARNALLRPEDAIRIVVPPGEESRHLRSVVSAVEEVSKRSGAALSVLEQPAEPVVHRGTEIETNVSVEQALRAWAQRQRLDEHTVERLVHLADEIAQEGEGSRAA